MNYINSNNLSPLTARELAVFYILAMRAPALITVKPYQLQSALEAQVGLEQTIEMIREARLFVDSRGAAQPLSGLTSVTEREPELSDHVKSLLGEALTELYPNLHFSKDLRAVWVNLEGTDGTNIAYGDVFELDLKTLDSEAATSRTSGYFFCTGHRKAEKISEYDFYHFSARYCRQWAKDHPADKRAAESESYE